MSKYVVLTRQENGEWLCGGCEPMPRRAAEKLAAFNRIMGGYTTTTFPAHEHDCLQCVESESAVSPAAPVTDTATSVVAARNTEEKEGLR